MEKPKSDRPSLRSWIAFAAIVTVFAVGLATCAQLVYGWLSRLWSG